MVDFVGLLTVVALFIYWVAIMHDNHSGGPGGPRHA